MARKINVADSIRAVCCISNHIHVEMIKNGVPVYDRVFDDPEDAYQFAQSVLRAVDLALED